MVGKTVVVIGGGAYSKKDIWPDAMSYGIKVILVDADPNYFAKEQVHKFIYYDYNDHVHDHTHAINIVDQLSNLDLEGCVDGCLTFWEDCGPLAAYICKILGLNGNDCNAALIAKTKSLTQITLRNKTDDIPHWPRTLMYSSATQPINSEKDLVNAADTFSFPAVLKLEYGSSAVGVSLCQTFDELETKYREIQNTLQSEEDYGGIGLGFGNNMAVMELLKGSEHDVDIVLFQRKLLGAFVSDNGPTRVPDFTETAATMPTTLPSDKAAQLITAAYQCCTEIGLSDGVFNVELKMTPTGPKLIEINARMGGFYLRDWIKRIYNVDLMLCAMMISCGIKPFIPKLKPKCQIMGVILVPSLHEAFLKSNSVEHNVIKGMTLVGDVIWNQFDQEVTQHVTSRHEEPMASIAVAGTDATDARKKLLTICDSLKISSENYSVADFTSQF